MPLYNQGGLNVANQFGMPLFGAGGPFPSTGNYFWVDGTNGSDGNTGGPQDPLKTLTQAHTKCLAGNNDVVFFSGTFSPTATLTWSKNNTSLIGLNGSIFSSAVVTTSLISVANTAATSGAFSPLVNVTASGCTFQNLSVISGINQAATQVCWAEAGGKNYYTNCNFNQVGNATAGAQAGNRALTIASLGNYFFNCVIGGDQIVRATGTNANIEFLATAGDNEFRTCSIPMYSSNAANVFITAATATMSGYTTFDDCSFTNNVQGAGAAASLTAAMTVNATAGGIVILDGCTVLVAAVTNAGVPVYTNSAASAAGGGRGTATN